MFLLAGSVFAGHLTWSTWVAAVSFVAAAAGLAYLGFATVRLFAFGARRAQHDSTFCPSITILKPLCGAEPELFENLSSFCAQDYPQFQVIFGVRDESDPAIDVVKRLVQDFPRCDIELVVDSRVRGTNLKVANLRNMFEHAKHDVIFIADSDTRVGTGYLRSVVASLNDPRAGAVTCLYRGMRSGKVASDLGVLFVNDWFAPSVLVAIALSPMDFAMGSTIALTRSTLERIGGLEALASHLADDRMLGKLVREQGLDVRLSEYVVDHLANEPSLAHLWRHEVRWGRTMFGARPVGYALSVITYPIPFCLLFWIFSGNMIGGAALTALAILLRLSLHYAARYALRTHERDRVWLLPLRGVLGVCVWAASLFTRNVRWRERDFSVDRTGRMTSSSEE